MFCPYDNSALLFYWTGLVLHNVYPTGIEQQQPTVFWVVMFTELMFHYKRNETF